MQIQSVDLDTFYRLMPPAPTVYDSRDFVTLNASRAESIECLVGLDEDAKPVVGQVFGRRDGLLRAPFSAPFSAPSVIGPAALPAFYAALPEGTRIVLPPPYLEVPVADSHRGAGEYNYHYDTSRFADYESHLSRSGRYSHHRALKTAWTFEQTDDIPRAYAVIEANRRAMGYPLAMSLEQVIATVTQAVRADFFVLSHEGTDLAAAMIYHVAPGIVQVIYWGDLPEARPRRAMNYLAYRVFGHYADRGIRIVDIGPASTDGIRNEGLCQFKLSVGCTETIRPTLCIG